MIRLLNEGVKPAFAANPHPQVDSTTGRKLAVAAGGERAKHEMFEDQGWKSVSSWGIVDVLQGCLTRLSVSTKSAYKGGSVFRLTSDPPT